MAATEWLEVEVVYALPQQQVVVPLRLAPGATLAEAVTQSGLLDRFPQADPAALKFGVFGVLADAQRALVAGDRVEIYRPLLADPKAARRARARRA